MSLYGTPINHPYGEPNLYNHKLNGMYATTSTRNNGTRKPRKDYRKAKRVRKAKSNAPGVPQNSCPYIDLIIGVMSDLSEAYDRMYEKGNPTPMTDKTEQIGKDLAEQVRQMNDTLRDNSKYWYDQFLELNAKYAHLKIEHKKLKRKK